MKQLSFIIPMSQWETRSGRCTKLHRQNLVQEQECWAVFHSPSLFFFFLTAYRSLAQKLVCFEPPAPLLWGLRGSGWFSVRCFFWYDRCSPRLANHLTSPKSQFSLWSKWTWASGPSASQFLLISVRSAEGLLDPGWYHLSGSAVPQSPECLASHWLGAQSDPCILSQMLEGSAHDRTSLPDEEEAESERQRVRDGS